jgi:hypothetical protein
MKIKFKSKINNSKNRIVKLIKTIKIYLITKDKFKIKKLIKLLIQISLTNKALLQLLLQLLQLHQRKIKKNNNNRCNNKILSQKLKIKYKKQLIR